LIDFVILPEFRSKGFGTELYNYYEAHCKKEGLKTIVAMVQETNKKMQNFCDKRGLKKGFKFYCYEKKI
jgi:GNAT superfamily N-acetyltransferase